MSFLLKKFQKYLTKLFDYQKFEQNAHLRKVIKKSACFDNFEKMNNEDLEQLSAAGLGIPKFPEK